MGLPAHARQSKPSTQPRLRLVPKRPAQVRTGVSARAARDAFAFCAIVLLAVCIFGLGRVALAARAFDDALAANQLEEAIKAERLQGDQLEVDKSALATPSRIESIAGTTMQMAEAGDVCYLEVSDTSGKPCVTSEAAAIGEEDEGETGSGIDRIVSAVKGLATTEVQSLLLGDVGLASTK